jgi:FADH2-dependent halogenase
MAASKTFRPDDASAGLKEESMLEIRAAEAPADVAIIGGGPAGSTAAALLASAGRRVVLFEKEKFPRFHIGESLLPFSTDLVRRLGIETKLQAEQVKKWGARLISSDGAVTRYICFEEGLVPGYPSAYQVLRSRFDEMLLQNAADRGAEIHQGVSVVEATASSRSGCELTVRDAAGNLSRHRARFLLDASGRDAFLASRKGLRRMTPHLRKAAVFAHYEGVARDEGRAAGDIILVILKDAWFWMIPLAGGRTSVGLVLEGAALKGSGLAPGDLLEESIRRCPAARMRMSGARRVSGYWTASDYSYRCREVAGDGYLLLGDAAAFIDPVFSTGVWLAMSSAEMAADTLHAALGSKGRKENLSPSVFAAYERKVIRHVRHYTRIVSAFYRPGFMDLFLQPSTRLGVKESVITLLAGHMQPPFSVRWRLALFYLGLRIHRFFPLRPAVPLLGAMEAPGPEAARAPAALNSEDLRA